MFQENHNLLAFSEYLLNKYPQCVKDNNTFKKFNSTAEEYNLLKNGVGLKINFEPVILSLTGADVLDFLHRISTNALKDIRNFEKRNTLFLNEKGKFIDRTSLIKLEEECLLVGSAAQNDRLFSWINKFIIAEDIKLKDVSSNYLLLDLIGRQTESFLSLLVGKENALLDDTAVKRFDVDGFTFHLFCNTENKSRKIYRLLLERGRCSEFIEHLFKIKSVFDFDLVGEDAFNAFRIENGIPAYPNEINQNSNPHEVNLLHEISFTKGCYIGQEVIARIDTYNKVQRKLVQFTFNGVKEFNGVQEIYDSTDSDAGSVTTSPVTEIFPDAKGLALIKKKGAENGEQFFARSGDKNILLHLSEVKNNE